MTKERLLISEVKYEYNALMEVHCQAFNIELEGQRFETTLFRAKMCSIYIE